LEPDFSPFFVFFVCPTPFFCCSALWTPRSIFKAANYCPIDYCEWGVSHAWKMS
jgi:hypothetical protein